MDDQFENGFSPAGGNDDGFGGGFLGGDSLGSYDGSTGLGQNDFGSGVGGSTGLGQNDFGSGVGGGTGFGRNDFGSGVGGSTGFGQNDFNAPMGGSTGLGQNDFGSGVGGSTGLGQNDFNAPMSGSTGFGQNDFGSGVGGSTGLGQNDFNSGMSGSSLNQAPEPYDPNFMFSDPSSGFGSSVGDPAFSASRVNTVTLPAKNKNKTVIAAVLLLAIAIGIGVGVYVMNNMKKSFRDWSNTADGKSFVAQMQKIADTQYKSDDYSIDVFVEGDDKLVIELTMTQYADLTQEEIDFVKEYTEQSMKSQMADIGKDIRKIEERYKIKDFMIVYRMTNSDGSHIYDIEIKG